MIPLWSRTFLTSTKWSNRSSTQERSAETLLTSRQTSFSPIIFRHLQQPLLHSLLFIRMFHWMRKKRVQLSWLACSLIGSTWTGCSVFGFQWGLCISRQKDRQVREISTLRKLRLTMELRLIIRSSLRRSLLKGSIILNSPKFIMSRKLRMNLKFKIKLWLEIYQIFQLFIQGHLLFKLLGLNLLMSWKSLTSISLEYSLNNIQVPKRCNLQTKVWLKGTTPKTKATCSPTTTTTAASCSTSTTTS